MKSIRLPLTFILIGWLGLGIACSSRQSESRNIPSIQAQEGIPVTAGQVESQDIYKTMLYSGEITGIRQSEVKSLLMDEIHRITVRLGDRVVRNQVVAELDTTNALAKYNQAKAALELYEKTYQRLKNVYEAGGISRQKLDEALTQLSAGRADFIASRNAVKLTAPISGIVTEITVKEGESPVMGMPLMKIAQLDTVRLIIQVGAEDISLFRRGDPAKIRLDRIYPGVVDQVSASANTISRHFKVEILIPNPDQTIQPGMYLEAEIQTRVKSNALVVPRFSVSYDDHENPYLFILKNDQAVKHPIRIGYQSDEIMEVLDSSLYRQTIALDGINLLSDGAKIKITTSPDSDSSGGRP